MKVRAKDTVHVSNVRAEPFAAGDTFELNEGEARQLIKRGLVTEVKAAAAPANKKAPEPKNKGAGGGTV